MSAQAATALEVAHEQTAAPITPEPAATVPAPAAPTFKAFFAAAECERRPGWRRWLIVGGSISAHAALLLVAGVYSFWSVDELSPPRMAVTFLTLPPAPPPPPPAARRAAAPERPKSARTPSRPVQPLLTRPAPTLEPAPPAEAASDEEAADTATPEGVAGGVADGVPGALPSVAPPPAPPPAPSPPKPPELSYEQRRALLQRYLQEILRTRVAAHRNYPAEAERLGLEGQVVVRAAIERSGALLTVKTMGACPHEILCEAALRAIRAAAPFPHPPPELGARIEVDVPFSYKLE